jgi:hypothetical protein
MKLLSRSIAALTLVFVVACNQPDPATRTEEGVYGASSGANPNLADLQTDQGTPQTRPEGDPASPGENAYPSQTGQPGEPPTGAEGGRSSAETGGADN